MTIKKFEKHLPLLKLLIKKRPSQKCLMSLIHSLDDKSIKFICECIYNAISLKNMSRLNTKQKSTLLKKLLPYKRIIKQLCKKTRKYSLRKNLIAQKGYGFIFPILSAIVPLVSSLLANQL